MDIPQFYRRLLAVLLALGLICSSTPVSAQSKSNKAADSAPVKVEAKGKAASKDSVSTGMFLSLLGFFIAMVLLGLWTLKFVVFGYSASTWDKRIESMPDYRPGQPPAYIEAETWPGLLSGLFISGRLYRIYVLTDYVIAIEYGQAGLQKVLKQFQNFAGTGGAAGAAGMIHASREVQNILRRMKYLDLLDEAGLVELAKSDKNSFISIRSDIRLIAISPKPMLRSLCSCYGQFTIRTKKWTWNGTFMDRDGQRHAKNYLKGGTVASIADLVSAIRGTAPSTVDVVELVSAEPFQAKH